MKKIILFLLTLLLVGALVGCINKNTMVMQESETVRSVPINSNNIVMNLVGDTIFVANIDVNTISIIDVATRKVKAEIPVGKEPRQLTLSPDESLLYVTCMYDEKVDVISVADEKVISSIKVGIEPFGIVTSVDGTQLFVSNYRSGTVSVIDLMKEEIIEEIKVGDRPRSLAMTDDGKKLYVPLYLEAKIEVIDTDSFDVVNEIALASSPDVSDPKKSQGIPNTLEQFVISPDGKRAWVPHLLTNIDTPIHFQETIFPAISVIDLEKDVEIIEERKELFEEMNVLDKKNETIIVSNPYDIVFHPTGNKVFAVMSGSEDLMVFDLVRGGNATQILRRITGDNPRGVTITPNGETLFVHNAMSHDVAMISTGGDSAYARAKMDGENIQLIKDDPLTPLVRKGKTIFYSGNSDEYSTDITGNNWMSCASCHSDGDMNSLTLQTGKGPRNVPSNVVTTKTGLFMWDGSRDDFTDYLLTVQGEMGGMMEFDPSEPLPEDVEAMFDAMFAFLDDPKSFPPPKSPHRNEDGSLTSTALEGEELFEGKAGCISCHGGEQFTNSVKALDEKGNLTTANVDFLYDIGTTNPDDLPSEGDGRANFENPRTEKQFDTPTLRGVWATGPYFHDGSAKSIEEAIVRHIYSDKPQLTQGEIAKIAEYVSSIE